MCGSISGLGDFVARVGVVVLILWVQGYWGDRGGFYLIYTKMFNGSHFIYRMQV